MNSDKTIFEKPRFSLCAIYKNEEKNLPAFIDRHMELMDEMILVDTGSTDQSNQIVKSYNIPYHFFQWTRNFSEARNYSLTLPTQDWIIVLDIDEHILKEDFLRLKEIITQKQKDAYSLSQINFSDQYQDINWKSITTLPPGFHSIAQGYIPSPLIRVFRNHEGIRFHGAIHELVGDSIHSLHLSSAITDIPIYHYGWIIDQRADEEKERKKKEYRELIKQEYQRESSPKMAFYYLSTIENPEEKIKIAFQLTRTYPEIKQFWEVMARSAVQLQQWTRAISYADKGLSIHKEHTPLLAIKAHCLIEGGKPTESIPILNSLLARDPQHPIYSYQLKRAQYIINRLTENEK